MRSIANFALFLEENFQLVFGCYCSRYFYSPLIVVVVVAAAVVAVAVAAVVVAIVEAAASVVVVTADVEKNPFIFLFFP